MMKRTVLFIGNSYTYFNVMPNMVAQLAADAGNELDWKMVAPGGWRLEQHSRNPETLEAINRATWTDAVLQDHSMGAIEAPESLRQYGSDLVRRVKDIEARPVLYLTWARQHSPGTQAAITTGYLALAAETGATVAPVGMAWRRALAGIPDLILHTEDQSHPNPIGSYLAACVFSGVLFGASPAGLTATVSIPDGDDLALDKRLANQLQTIAWETVQSL